MRKSSANELQDQIAEFYNRIQEILIIRGIKWTDLAKLIGVSPKTLSSMRSQNVNPSWTTVRKIAKALDVSMDELTYENKSANLYELYWAIPREIKNQELQETTCNQFLTMTHLTAKGDVKDFRQREDICREEIHEKLEEMKGKKNLL